jgi:parvulin-like peptidyl-prolyl isomerase
LSKGEVSQVVFINGQYSLLKLIKREPGSVDPLDQVRKQIFDKLWSDKFTVLRDDYISKLREAAQISVDEKVWKKTRKEIMQNEKETS